MHPHRSYYMLPMFDPLSDGRQNAVRTHRFIMRIIHVIFIYRSFYFIQIDKPDGVVSNILEVLNTAGNKLSNYFNRCDDLLSAGPGLGGDGRTHNDNAGVSQIATGNRADSGGNVISVSQHGNISASKPNLKRKADANGDATATSKAKKTSKNAKSADPTKNKESAGEGTDPRLKKRKVLPSKRDSTRPVSRILFRDNDHDDGNDSDTRDAAN